MAVLAPPDAGPLAAQSTLRLSAGGAESNVARGPAALGHRAAWLRALLTALRGAATPIWDRNRPGRPCCAAHASCTCPASPRRSPTAVPGSWRRFCCAAPPGRTASPVHRPGLPSPST
ncbi:hypothetical protein ACFS5L_17025 [Streptomyces phyllanthi]